MYKPQSSCIVFLLMAAFFAVPAIADDLDGDMNWSQVTAKGNSLVFGRLEGRFDGADFRDRSLEFRRLDDGKKYDIEVGEGLGYFEAVLPPGEYEIRALEATYSPIGRPINPQRYRPVRQRYGVTPKPSETTTIPTFLIPTDRPVYIGTVSMDNDPDGIVYRGHYISIIDEYDETFGRLAEQYPKLVKSLEKADIGPARHFMLRPRQAESPLDLIEVEDPIERARQYIAEGKFQQAVNWLNTFMPASDRERHEALHLIGEAYLGDGKYPEAIQNLGDVLEANPENLRALRLLARAHLFHEDIEDALNLYGALAEELPGDAEANLHLGYLFAVRSEPIRSTEAFNSAFRYDHDYLLHDLGPFAGAMQAARDQALEYIPARVVRQRVKPPRGLESRRGAQSGGVAIVIDHNGKVVAAQVSPRSTESAQAMMLAMIRATFKPASLNGVSVPSILLMGGGSGGSSGR
jgi:tetratricopeptide (TPR) repeat protein